MNNLKIEVIQCPTNDDWVRCKQCALVTVDKKTTTPPNEEWKKKILKARHSPIRELHFCFSIQNIPSWIATHLARHIHAQPYVKSQRNDRQSNYDRNSAPQDTPVNMMWSMNAEELITIANKRLCNQASEETRIVIKEICKKTIEVCPELKDELVPMCVRNGGKCYELFPCYKG